MQNGELFNVVCKQGKLIITKDTIAIVFGNKRSQIYRQALTGIESKVTSPKFLWSPGTTKIIFHTGTEHLEASMIRTPVANEVLAELNRR